MKLSYASHKEIKLGRGQITTLGTCSPVVYTELIQGMQGLNEQIRLFDDEYNECAINRAIDWCGDVACRTIEVNQYLTKLERLISEALTDDDRNQIHDCLSELYSAVEQQLFLTDLPLEVTYDFDMKHLLKFAKIHFDEKWQTNPYDIIESILKVHQECDIESCVVLTNVAHYLKASQMYELEDSVVTTGQSLLLLEFCRMNQHDYYDVGSFNFIDEDFVDWY
ncbi:type II-A CRISPR-associated protein Csn2 [Lactiplantibacillus plantarum]|uniref:type II-A CRISPR-associated protein Csn2 n=1 Tax=Lactiplantibacillus plantarum TaxID=1590 RepID=UPI0025551585|nr:type II-A CRISPR-associated protein Csn2 [Lactiplantibacillus plantarum]